MATKGLRSRRRTLDPVAARAELMRTSLLDRPVGPVGLELESHLVDLAAPGTRVGWQRLTEALTALPALPGDSRVTIEPGGQVELSGPPAVDVSAAVLALRADRAVLARHLAGSGLGLATIGTDPLRPAARIHPGARYAAMEQHFAARGTREAGLAMMTSTASLQVNLEAGPADRWRERVGRAHRLGPVLVTISACSPALAGTASGWRSTRQRVWGRLDRARCGPLLGRDEPGTEWADYALAAPVLLVRAEGGADGDGGMADVGAEPVLTRVPFAAWIAGAPELADRPATAADLDYHLTTLFPPVRLRGFLEIRYLDAAPEPWWPALAAVTAVLMDTPELASAVDRQLVGVAGAWDRAARLGVGDDELRAAAVGCLDLARAACPTALHHEVEALRELVAAGRSPGDTLPTDPTDQLLWATEEGLR